MQRKRLYARPDGSKVELLTQAALDDSGKMYCVYIDLSNGVHYVESVEVFFKSVTIDGVSVPRHRWISA